MATQAADLSSGHRWTVSPTPHEVITDYFTKNPDARFEHPDPYDVSRSDIYAEHRWQPIFAELRAKGPLHRVEKSPYGPYWSVVQHKAVQHVESLPELFSSSWQHGGITILDRPEPEDGQEAFELPMFIAMDRPQHTGQRRTVAPAFTPTEMKRLEDSIRQRTGEVLEGLPHGTQFDWVQSVSIELTTQMLAILFDFPWEDRHLLTFWSDWAGDTELAGIRDLDGTRRGILYEMAAYFQQLWQQRAQLGEAPDLISMMIHSPAMNKMSPQEFMGNLVLLIVGGNDTTRNTMSGIIHAFDRFPDQRKLFEEKPDLIPNAVQECIRFQTPLKHMRRTASEDTELFGKHIKKGDKVILWYNSANRDEQVFDDADRLDIERENARRHLAFGYGIHRCVGARLAELQLRILLEEIHARRLRVEVTGEVERVRANFVEGFRKLEVTLSKF
ncbi:cytochrome P450 [Altererythrobacter aurantiacus]|uniref:Cytochrome P450 n=1 Tax=Parapontixanthobacter aurantiacus TaxID=1463599 RepID=A0A844ZFZ7_9SPHN|nr:cytochrome P450 [Parapontixanthobacter aurantiacus]MXO86066.1 cytochrome P450 [Parapontixanthobacter aurantiacus]